MIRIKLMYKIHCLRVGQGMAHSAGNDTFYEELENEEGTGALDMARKYVCNVGSLSDSMVIYKAHVIVRKSEPPVEVLNVRQGGLVVPL